MNDFVEVNVLKIKVDSIKVRYMLLMTYNINHNQIKLGEFKLNVDNNITCLKMMVETIFREIKSLSDTKTKNDNLTLELKKENQQLSNVCFVYSIKKSYFNTLKL